DGVRALDGVSLSLPAGSFTAVTGPSGSGKSTLLACAAGLDRPTGGLVVVDGTELTGDEAEVTRFRRERIGVVFQRDTIVPTLTVLQNVTLPLRLAAPGPAAERAPEERATAVLRRIGLGERLSHPASRLSGGQRQRVAIARALVTEPSVLLADEPTGTLDIRGAREVLALLRRAVSDFGTAVVMATHDPVAAAHADAVVFLADGRTAGRLASPTAAAVAERLAHLGDVSHTTAGV
ncbi:ABC transporter ATP-binding protein, partial [Streptomyces sp. SBT349]|uniref:ABC transporter ATP-binding protein n=1 Tax=Streptomyces sp. SBT349 TaxID=1580539 RepID=UPI00066EF195